MNRIYGCMLCGIMSLALLSGCDMTKSKIQYDMPDSMATQETSNSSGDVMMEPEFTMIVSSFVDDEASGIQFTYHLVEVDDDGDPVGFEMNTQNASEGAGAGVAIFDPIEYGNPDASDTYWYLVTQDAVDGYSCDKETFTVQVSVTKAVDRYIITSAVSDTDGVGFTQPEFYNFTGNKTGKSTTTVNVAARWKNDGSDTNSRPESITVYLLRDGERYDNISSTLSEFNDWKLSWTDLPRGGQYSVYTEKSDGYSTSVDVGETYKGIVNITIFEKYTSAS